MRSDIVLLALFMGIAGCVPIRHGNPIAVFDQSSKDFGIALQGQVLTHRFKLVNRGTAVLRVITVRSS